MKYPIKIQYIIIASICILILLGLSYYFYKEGFQSSSDDTSEPIIMNKFQGTQALYICSGFKDASSVYKKLLVDEKDETKIQLYNSMISTLDKQLKFHNCEESFSEATEIPAINPVIEGHKFDLNGNLIEAKIPGLDET